MFNIAKIASNFQIKLSRCGGSKATKMLLIYSLKEQGYELEVLYLDSFDVATGIPKTKGMLSADCQKFDIKGSSSPRNLLHIKPTLNGL